jgi:hypothetical protein
MTLILSPHIPALGLEPCLPDIEVRVMLPLVISDEGDAQGIESRLELRVWACRWGSCGRGEQGEEKGEESCAWEVEEHVVDGYREKSKDRFVFALFRCCVRGGKSWLECCQGGVSVCTVG